jgi:predicted nuclease of restriction endonuclease-like RecB superfamily
LKLTKGLNKIILDRCEFSQAEEHDYPERRKEIFLKAAKLLKKGFESYEAYYDEIITDNNAGRFASGDIFADLPENETLSKFKLIFPRELLERYNCAQVQSLLFNASEMEIKVSASEPAKLRRLFKYLKFFRLLADIERLKTPAKDKTQVMSMSISGPASMFENSRKYGLQLASFFPALCAMDKWQLKADVKLGNKIYRLNLDESSNLVSHYHNFSAYIPEEVIMFHRLFKEKVDDWQIIGDTPFMKGKKQEVIFPDLNFQNNDGKIIHLELFHRWHRGALLKRLEFCEDNPELPLLLGVDRSLLKGELPDLLENSSYFQKKGFLFRDFPGVSRVKKLLEQNT